MVIKLGTGVLGNVKDGFDRSVFASVLRQVSALRRRGIGTVIVSSGAILAARHNIISLRRKRSLGLLSEPALASMGQPLLMREWTEAGGSLCPPALVAQVLPTEASIHNRHEWNNSKHVILDCLVHGIIVVVNYNDPLSCTAIELLLKQANDNDKLTADVAPHIGATSVLFLTQAGGVHSDNPANGNTRLYREIDWRNPPCGTEGAGEPHGRGGMAAKIKYAVECRKAHIRRVCITGLTSDSIIRFANGENPSTMVGSRNILES